MLRGPIVTRRFRRRRALAISAIPSATGRAEGPGALPLEETDGAGISAQADESLSREEPDSDAGP